MDEIECAKRLAALANWHPAPVRTEWGDDGMMVAYIELSKDETLTIYAHRDAIEQLRKVFCA